MAKVARLTVGIVRAVVRSELASSVEFPQEENVT
jgi:hypothetical protein